MKLTTTQFLSTAVCAFLSLFLLAGCSRGPLEQRKQELPEVTVGKPVSREVTNYFEFPGQTEAVGDVEIRARVTGYLMNVNFVDGQIVAKGDLLYGIDPRPYEAMLHAAEANLAQDKATLSLAMTEFLRAEQLLPKNAISGTDYDQAKNAVAVTKARVQSAEAAVETARLNLDFCSITSPINGRVSRTRITEGNLVQPGTGVDAVLTTVVTTNPIYVYFNVDETALLQYEELAMKNGGERQLRKLKDLKFPVEIGLANEKGFPHAGMLDFADNKIDRNTGTLRARGVFENTNEYLTPGLFVRVRIPFGEPHQALLIEERAIGANQKQKYLLTVNQDDVVESRSVTVGRLLDGMRVIKSGLNPDDRVIVNGLLRARPTSKVKPTLATRAPAAPAEQPVANASKSTNN